MDFSKMSDDELKDLITRSEQRNAAQGNTNNPGLIKSALQGYGNYAKGAIKGMGQSLGDIGASVANVPISVAEYLSGRQLPHVPHPNLVSENPDSLSESIGQNIGQLGGALIAPGGAGFKAAQLANRGYQAVRAGRELPLISRILAGSAGGAIEGAAGNENNRMEGAEVGAALGGLGHAIPEAINFSRSIKSSNIANEIRNYLAHQQEHYGNEFQNTLNAGEESGANQFLRPEYSAIRILNRSRENKTAYALMKYNNNPTLLTAHDAQSDLGAVIRKYALPKGTQERDTLAAARRAQNRLLNQIQSSLQRSGAPHIGEEYGNLRNEYRQYVGPYLNSPTISKLTEVDPSIRPNKFADELLKEERFMARAGQYHPNLIGRERYNAIKRNRFAQGAAAGSAALAGGLLSYPIAKALGLR
jgi:hypothetical protein